MNALEIKRLKVWMRTHGNGNGNEANEMWKIEAKTKMTK